MAPPTTRALCLLAAFSAGAHAQTITSAAAPASTGNLLGQLWSDARSLVTSVVPSIGDLSTFTIPTTLVIDGSTLRIPAVALPTGTSTSGSSSSAASPSSSSQSSIPARTTTPTTGAAASSSGPSSTLSSAATSVSSSIFSSASDVLPTSAASDAAQRVPSATPAADSGSNSGSGSNKLGIILGVVFGLLALIILALLLCLCLRRRRRKRSDRVEKASLDSTNLDDRPRRKGIGPWIHRHSKDPAYSDEKQLESGIADKHSSGVPLMAGAGAGAVAGGAADIASRHPSDRSISTDSSGRRAGYHTPEESVAALEAVNSTTNDGPFARARRASIGHNPEAAERRWSQGRPMSGYGRPTTAGAVSGAGPQRPLSEGQSIVPGSHRPVSGGQPSLSGNQAGLAGNQRPLSQDTPGRPSTSHHSHNAGTALAAGVAGAAVGSAAARHFSRSRSRSRHSPERKPSRPSNDTRRISLGHSYDRVIDPVPDPYESKAMRTPTPNSSFRPTDQIPRPLSSNQRSFTVSPEPSTLSSVGPSVVSSSGPSTVSSSEPSRGRHSISRKPVPAAIRTSNLPNHQGTSMNSANPFFSPDDRKVSDYGAAPEPPPRSPQRRSYSPQVHYPPGSEVNQFDFGLRNGEKPRGSMDGMMGKKKFMGDTGDHRRTGSLPGVRREWSFEGQPPP